MSLESRVGISRTQIVKTEGIWAHFFQNGDSPSIFHNKFGSQVRLGSLDMGVYFQYLSQQLWGMQFGSQMRLGSLDLGMLFEYLSQQDWERDAPGIP